MAKGALISPPGLPNSGVWGGVGVSCNFLTCQCKNGCALCEPPRLTVPLAFSSEGGTSGQAGEGYCYSAIGLASEKQQ